MKQSQTREVYYEVEEFYPGYENQGWAAEWVARGDLEGVPDRYESEDEARAAKKAETDRIVRVTREVVGG